jgi:hypothetical protein
MKNFFAAGVIVLLSSALQAQTPTYSEEVAPIIYNNCTKCHRNGGIAPFKLESYSDAYLWHPYIATEVNNRTMPPWPPDVSYSRFMHERTLTQDEINTIVAWANAGAPQGDPQKEPAVPQFPPGKILPGVPDLTLRMPVYESKADHVDEYACFPIPSGLTEDKFIRAIEIVPGNPSIVHHVIVFAADSTITDCTMPILAGQTLMGYAPGAPPTVFPSGNDLKLGMKLKAGSNIMLQLHYPMGTAGEIDSTSVNFYFYPDGETGIRAVTSGPYLQNFIFPPIQPNTVVTVDGWYTELEGGLQLGGTTREDMSLFAVFPHMHLIGRSIISYAITPDHDTIRLVNINDWDFHWQGFYFFKNLIKIPAGSRLAGRGIYDNTSNNHHNPFHPPQTISVGEATTDEMFLISYLSLPYQPGDENYDLESLISLPVSADEKPAQGGTRLTVFPNPSSGTFTIAGWQAVGGEKTEVNIIDMLGKNVFAGRVDASGSPIRISTENISEGIYFIHLKDSQHQAMQKIAVKR